MKKLGKGIIISKFINFLYMYIVNFFQYISIIYSLFQITEERIWGGGMQKF